MEKVIFRAAVPGDEALVLYFIKKLAEYEKLSDQVTADEALLHRWMFEEGRAEAIFPMFQGREAGFALFFHNFSTFQGRAGIYLEDLFILPEFRGRGLGRAALSELARIARERGCGRLEWVCLDWNRPSIELYLSLGAVPMSDWTIYRMTGPALDALAES